MTEEELVAEGTTVDLSKNGEGPYVVTEEGHGYEVEAMRAPVGGLYLSAADFVSGVHDKKTAIAIAAFMNWWWRENQREALRGDS